MIFDVFRSILQIAVPFSGVDLNQVCQKVFQFTGEVGRKTEDARSCFFKDLYRLVSGKRRDATSELIDEDAKRPPVDSLAIPLVQDDVRCEVLWRRTQRPCSPSHAFCPLKTGDLEVALVVKEKIFRFQVPINHIEAVLCRYSTA